MPQNSQESPDIAALANELEQMRAMLGRAIDALKNGRSSEGVAVAKRTLTSLSNIIKARCPT